MSPFTLGLGKCYTWVLGHEGGGERHRARPAAHSSRRTRGSRACSLGGGQLPPWGADLTCCWPPSLPVGGPPPGGHPGPRAEDGAGNALVFLKVHGRARAAGVWGTGGVQAPESGAGGKRDRVPAASSLPSVRALSFIGRPDRSLGKITLMGFVFSSRNKDLRRNRKQRHVISQACAVGCSHLCEPVSFRKDAHFLTKNVSLFLKNGFLVHCPRNSLVLGRCVCALSPQPSGPGWGPPAGGCSTRKGKATRVELGCRSGRRGSEQRGLRARRPPPVKPGPAAGPQAKGPRKVGGVGAEPREGRRAPCYPPARRPTPIPTTWGRARAQGMWDPGGLLGGGELTATLSSGPRPLPHDPC